MSEDAPSALNVKDVPPRSELRIGVSSCLLGEEVRFDGGHKLDHFLVDTLARYVQFVEVCPEVGIGLGVPRETVRLVQIGARVHMVGNKTGADHTAAMERFAARKAEELEALDLSGYVLKKDSPSCGMERVRVYNPESGMPAKDGRGLFAVALMARMPLLPIEEEGRLRDARLRENFIERIFAYRRLKNLFAPRWTRGDLVAFHTAHKLSLLAHDPPAYQALGRLVAEAKERPRAALAEEYQRVFMTALHKHASVRKQTNVLTHMAGYFKKVLDAAAKAELAQVIDDYRRGLVPLVVPLTLVRHYVRLHRVEYLAGQVYLEPHPKEMMLRNHV